MRFRLRLILSISLLIAITFGIGGSLLISTSFQSALEEEKASAISSYESVRSTLYLLNSLGDQKNYGTLTKSLAQLKEQRSIQWEALVLREEGAEFPLYSDGNAENFDESLAAREDSCVYTILRDSESYYLRASGLLPVDDTALVLDACFDISSAYTARARQQYLFIVIYVAVVVLGIFVATVMAFSMTKQLNRLTVTAKRIAAGDLSKRSRIRTGDEIGQLSAAFDSMADHLQENIDELKDSMQRQEAFMGAFAHELKTPMTSIIGYADLLRQDVLENHDKIAAARYIFSEGQRLEKLSFQLLDLLLMEKDQINLRKVSFHSFTGEIERALLPVLRRRGIRFVCRSDRGSIQIDPDLVKSLLYNLIDNAAKAIDGEGVIAFAARLGADGCRFQVADNGRGMTQEEVKRVMEPFYRVDKSRSRAQGGAGLGLSLCGRIVELHKGRLHIASTPGKGTTVTVFLPRGEEARHEQN